MVQPEQIEKVLTDLGVMESYEQKIKEAGFETKPAETTPIVETPVEQTPDTPATQPEKPVEQVKTEIVETPKPVEIWKDIIPTTEPVEPDWKAEFEKTKADYDGYKGKIENDPILKKLLDVKDSPNYDPEKFIESISTKKIDFTQIPVENLFKQRLADNEIANYTAEEIDNLWEEKKAELTENPTAAKTLKSELVGHFQSQQPQEVEEPEILKQWKEESTNQRLQIESARKEQLEIAQKIKDFSTQLVGKKIAGEIEITKEDAEAISERMDANYYRGKDGKLDESRLTLDRLKAVKFDQMVQYFTTQYKKDAVIEARNEIAKPNPNQNGGGQVINTDTRDDATKIIEQGMASMGLKTDLVLKK